MGQFQVEVCGQPGLTKIPPSIPQAVVDDLGLLAARTIAPSSPLAFHPHPVVDDDARAGDGISSTVANLDGEIT